MCLYLLSCLASEEKTYQQAERRLDLYQQGGEIHHFMHKHTAKQTMISDCPAYNIRQLKETKNPRKQSDDLSAYSNTRERR